MASIEKAAADVSAVPKKRPSRAAIKDCAEGLLIAAEVADIYPVPLETVAEYLGFEILAFEMRKDVSGAIQYDQKKIYINESDSAVRQRFTLAHELGHAQLHQGENVIDYRATIDSPDPTNTKEVDANHFAACLLMPSEQFLWVWRAREGDAKRTAIYFGVSEIAATIRAKTLGLA